MLVNNAILVGRITSEPELIELEDGKKYTSIILAVNRNYKNEEGIYETDFIKCVLWNYAATNTVTYCRSGDVIGVKGRIQSSNYTDENGKKHYVTEIIAEKVTFLQSNKQLNNENETIDNSESKSNKKKKEKERDEIN